MKKGKIIAAALAGVVLVGAIVALVVNLTAEKCLKYDWGTSLEEVRKNEYVYEEHVPGEEGAQFFYYKNYVLVCEDPEHTVDPLKEFDIEGDKKGTWDLLISDKVTYEFSASDQGLFHVYYEYDGMSFAERMEIAKKHYGKGYYVHGNTADQYDSAVWKKGDTVIFIGYDDVDYYDADYYIAMLEGSPYGLTEQMEGVLNFLKGR